MTSRIALMGLIAFAMGCDDGEIDKETTGDTGATITDDTGPDTGPYDGPVLVELAEVTCTDTRSAYFYAETAGWTSSGLWFSQETANNEPQWADEHDLESFEYDKNGAWDHLEQTVSTNADFASWAVNASTVFSCEPSEHFDGSAVMTYAIRVYDIDGAFADCLAFGHDVSGMQDGTYDRVNEPTAPAAELDQCVEGVAAR